MNIVAYLSLLLIGVILWYRSGVSPTQKYFWIALAVLLVIWWGIWGQVAVYDGWWTYSAENITFGYVGHVPAADLLYFFAGLGWYLYLSRKLDLI